MADDPRPPDDRLLLALTTEHFTLQTARSATISESNGRVMIFLSTLSSCVVALAFVGQSTSFGTTFYVFVFTLFPAVLIVGFATFMRALQVSVEDAYFAIAINRIRQHYVELHPDAAELFVLPTTAGITAIRPEALNKKPSRIQALFTAAGMVACVESIVAGVFAALIVDRVVEHGTAAVVTGVVVTLGGIVGTLIYIRTQFFRALAVLGVVKESRKS